MTTSFHSPECRRLIIDYCACMLTPRVTAGRSPQADTRLMLPCRTRPGPSWPKPCDCLASFRKKATDAGNPATSTPISPHKATDAGELGPLGPHLSAQGHRRGGTRPTRPPSFRTKPQIRGNPANSAPISPHKATDAEEPGPARPPSLRTRPQTRRNQANSTPSLRTKPQMRGNPATRPQMRGTGANSATVSTRPPSLRTRPQMGRKSAREGTG